MTDEELLQRLTDAARDKAKRLDLSRSDSAVTSSENYIFASVLMNITGM